MATKPSDCHLFNKKRAYSKQNISPEHRIKLIILEPVT